MVSKVRDTSVEGKVQIAWKCAHQLLLRKDKTRAQAKEDLRLHLQCFVSLQEMGFVPLSATCEHLLRQGGKCMVPETLSSVGFIHFPNTRCFLLASGYSAVQQCSSGRSFSFQPFVFAAVKGPEKSGCLGQSAQSVKQCFED